MSRSRNRGNSRRIRFLDRNLVDELGQRWNPVASGTYFVEDPAALRNVLGTIHRVLIKSRTNVVEEIAAAAAGPRLLRAVPSSRELGGWGVKLYERGDALIAVLQELH